LKGWRGSRSGSLSGSLCRSRSCSLCRSRSLSGSLCRSRSLSGSLWFGFGSLGWLWKIVVRSHKSIKTKKNHYSSGSRYCRRLGSHTLSTMPKISFQASQAFNPSTRQPGSNTTTACSSGTRYCRRLGTTARRSSRIHSNCYHFFYNRRPHYLQQYKQTHMTAFP